MPPLDLEPHQRAIVVVRSGALELRAGDERLLMGAGDCVEVEGQRLTSSHTTDDVASLMLIVSPRGDLLAHLGPPANGRAIAG